eukprot:320906-Chlamydomonas_euryale.AAC.1
MRAARDAPAAGLRGSGAGGPGYSNGALMLALPPPPPPPPPQGSQGLSYTSPSFGHTQAAAAAAGPWSHNHLTQACTLPHAPPPPPPPYQQHMYAHQHHPQQQQPQQYTPQHPHQQHPQLYLQQHPQQYAQQYVQQHPQRFDAADQYRQPQHHGGGGGRAARNYKEVCRIYLNAVSVCCADVSLFWHSGTIQPASQPASQPAVCLSVRPPVCLLHIHTSTHPSVQGFWCN